MISGNFIEFMAMFQYVQADNLIRDAVEMSYSLSIHGQ